MIRSAKLISILILLVFLISGCYQGAMQRPTEAPSAGTTIGPSMSSSPVSGGEITIPMPNEPYTTHPLFIKEVEMSDIYSMVFEPLITLDEQMQPAVSIANGWETDVDNGTVTVRLRSGVRFHDNTELTASDVVFTFNMILDNPESPYHGLVSRYVESVEAIDKETVVFTAKIFSFAFYYALNVPIIPEAIYATVDQKTDIIPIGSGSFTVTAIDVSAQSSMELVRNVYWWKKQPYIEKIHAVGYKDNNQAIAAFMRGELDCVPTAIYTTDIYDGYDGVSCYSYMSNYYDFLAPNFRTAALTEKNVRQAISYAIDRKSIISNIYLSHGISMEYPFASDSGFNNTDIMRYDHSIDKAKQLLDDAGWIMGTDGFRYKNNKKLSLNIVTVRNDDNPVRQDTAEMISRQLALVGIEITVTVLSRDLLQTAIEQSDYDLLLTGYYLSDSPDVAFAFYTDGSGNLMNYSDPDCNSLLDSLNGAITRTDYTEKYGQFQQYISQQLPQIGLIGFSQTILHKDSLIPTGIHRDLRVYQNIDKWYVAG